MFLLIDLQHIYYRFWYTKEKLQIQRSFDGLPPLLRKDGRDITHVKAVFDECVRIVKDFEFHYDVSDAKVCVCLDKETQKKELFPEYKANRQNRLDADNYAEIAYIAKSLAKRGATVYEQEGFEADDLIHSLVTAYPEEEIAIYTSDADLLMHVNNNVDVWIRRKNEYRRIKGKLFIKQVSALCKREVLFNDIVLYKSCVGDASDNIKGIRGFGEAAYRKKIEVLPNNIIVPTDKQGVIDFAVKHMGFNDTQLEQFKYSLELVYPLICENLEKPKETALGAFKE